MSVEGEICTEAVEQKLASLSPSMQSDLSTDGDASVLQNSTIPNDQSSVTSFSSLTTSNEPKAKKRRKQSNPLKIQNATSPKFELPTYDFVEQTETEASQPVSYTFEEGVLNQNHVGDKCKTPDSASPKVLEKGVLSRVTNALYNSKIQEVVKVNKPGNKSKESSLQSLTDISSPESSEEVISANELKNAMHISYPQMPPLLPINPVDIANDATKLSNLYPFNEFPSPVQQGSVSLPISHRSFITSSGVRVFNPEAYCELCEKEFCNKYFLKTHKANKHGICTSDNNTGGYSYRVSYKSMHMNSQATQQAISQMCENGATFGSADSYCNICQKYFCNKYFLKKHRQNIHGIQENQDTSSIPSSIHVPVISSPLPLVRSVSQESKSMENSSGPTTKEEESKINVSLENIKNSLSCGASLVNGSSPHTASHKNVLNVNLNQKEKKNEKFLCELCNIEFYDKCYLDSHKQNKHGPIKIPGTEFPEFSEVGKIESGEKSSPTDDTDELKDNFKGQMCAPCMKNFTSAESFQKHMLEIHSASLKEEDETSRMSDTVSKKNGQNFEKDISQVIEKCSAMQEIENSNSSSDSGSFVCGLCFAKLKDKNNYVIHMETEHGFLGTSVTDETGHSQENSLQCEACSEQFPDRLTFLSHKLKSHGIISPGLEALADSIENGDLTYFSAGKQKSSNSSFCQICNKELCNKYFMKTHMMKMHGIDVDKIQQEKWSALSGGVYCDICQKFLCSKYFLKIHKQNVHGIIEDSSKLAVIGSPMPNVLGIAEKKSERLSGNYSQGIKFNNRNDPVSSQEDSMKRSSNNMFSCDICGQEFLNKLFLQVHLVNKHVKCNESKSSLNMAISSYSQSAEESKDALKSGILPCSCCSYVNIDSSNTSHISSPEFKIVLCIICNMTYHQSEYHTHHLTHGTSLPVGKKLPNLENGVHELGFGFNDSGNNAFDPNNKSKLHPRKFKRFRCSKCDKTFRTKIKCLHHIQVMHKSKKSLSNPCDQQHPSKKSYLSNVGCKKNTLNEGTGSGGIENCSNSLHGGIEAEKKSCHMNSNFHETSAPLPVPYILPKNSDVIMQPFHLSEPKPEGITKQDIFVPSLVYLPVSQKVSEPLTVAFTLTPA